MAEEVRKDKVSEPCCLGPGGPGGNTVTGRDGKRGVSIMRFSSRFSRLFLIYGNIVSSGLVVVSGKVDGSGQVKVSLSRGEQHASGTWTGKSSSTAGKPPAIRPGR
jgi:hypothetical protein